MRRNISSRFKNMVHLFGFGLLAIVAFAHVAAAQNMPQSFADIVEDLMPAVVNISISTTVQNPPGIQMSPFEDFFEEFMERDEKEQPKNRRVSSLGSGFIIDPSGIVITNNHVVENAEEIIVNFSNGEKFKAELLGRDPKTDLAVLKVITDKKLPFVKFGDNTKARVGDWVIAIGNPFGLGGSLSVGVISAINRDINSGPYDSYIQTDAAINKGNSGGPLFNLDGEVIGVNTAIISPTGGSVGIGFSIPADMAQIVITQLREYGETRRGWLGVRIQRI
ncbi:MAG: trypsin-like peptidase domain-containing protein, partial [Pseudomonadota bacterium]|nr:trypsin-like peptidase domain-containing protein [Pseudomonadota bacterium]